MTVNIRSSFWRNHLRPVCPIGLLAIFTLIVSSRIGHCQNEREKAEERGKAAAIQASNTLYQIQMQLQGQLQGRISKALEQSNSTNGAQSEARTKTIEKYRQQGYSEEEIKMMLDPSAGMNGLMERFATQLKNRSRTNAQANIPPPRSEAEIMNAFRQSLGDLADQNPKLFEKLRERTNHSAASSEVLETWFQNQWSHWNDSFEEGTPFNRLMGRKQNADPLEMIPGDAQENGPGMSLLALNLKGLVVDRELRLQTALAVSRDPQVMGWREKLWQLQIESLRSRPQPVSAAEQGFAPKEILRNSPFTIIENKKIEAAEQELRLKGISLPGVERREIVSASNVAEALAPDCALVEFIRYGRDPGGLNLIEERFGAVVIARGKEAVWVSLGRTADILPIVKEYVAFLRKTESSAAADSEMKTLLERLCGAIWAPIESTLSVGTKKLLIAPDGDLHLVSFAGLLRKDRFLCEDFDIGYVAGGRDVLEKSNPLKNKDIEIWADPDFDGDTRQPTKMPAAQSGWSFGFWRTRAFGVKFDRLEGTAKESANLKEAATRIGNASVRVHTGMSATEKELRSLNAPFLLHLGTHGFFLPFRDGADRPWGTAGFENEFKGDAALYQSGIALAGANKAFNSVQSAELPSPENDGILLAAEAAQLNLRGTWLVTVSACDSGIGAVADGESLLGLKVGFLQAGAKNVMLSLWRVNDSYTPEFMKAFYERALKTGDPCAALSAVQRVELRKFSKDGGKSALWRALKLAGPFAVTSRAL